MEQKCFICKTNLNLHKHHVFFGTGERKLSEKYNMVCCLCWAHHTGPKGVHNNRELDLIIKRHYQKMFEEAYNRTKFIETFGRNYL